LVQFCDAGIEPSLLPVPPSPPDGDPEDDPLPDEPPEDDVLPEDDELPDDVEDDEEPLDEGDAPDDEDPADEEEPPEDEAPPDAGDPPPLSPHPLAQGRSKPRTDAVKRCRIVCPSIQLADAGGAPLMQACETMEL
jgi:hypothetical protein